MCRMLIYTPLALGDLRQAVPEQAAALTRMVRPSDDLLQGIVLAELAGAGAALQPSTVLAASQTSHTVLLGDLLPLLWQAWRELGDYGRLALMRRGEQVTLAIVEPDRWAAQAAWQGITLPEVVAGECGECAGPCLGWLCHPHPGRSIRGCYAEVFGSPDHGDLCGCVLDDDPAADDEDAATFRTAVEGLIGQQLAQGVVFLDKDVWYAEPDGDAWATMLALLSLQKEN